MKKLTIVFQGDSITDAGRNKADGTDIGPGYVKYASEAIAAAFPDVEFTFINRGINANRTCQLFDRLYPDALIYKPDIISVLIGVNDLWHRYEDSIRIETSDAQLALNYRSILESIRRNSGAKIVMLTPYVLDNDDYPLSNVKEDLKTALPIIKGLASEFADAFIPLDEHFEKALETQPAPRFYSADGVHPNDEGRKFIGKLYAEAVIPLIKSLIK